jgi:hypothetical protein
MQGINLIAKFSIAGIMIFKWYFSLNVLKFDFFSNFVTLRAYIYEGLKCMV